MLFRHSAIREVTRETATEAWDRLPVDIHPALIGSGELAIAVDATGMQGLNSQLTQYRDCASLEHTYQLTERHLHLYRDEALSNHYMPATPRWAECPDVPTWSAMPLGYLDYVLSVDGDSFDAARLAAEGRAWQRRFTPRSGTLVTAFTIGAVRVTWTQCMAMDAVECDFGFAWEALDRQEHAVTLEVACVLRLRDGRPITAGGLTDAAGDYGAMRQWQASDATSTAPLLAPVTVNWGLTCTTGTGETRQASASEHALHLVWRSGGCAGRTVVRVVSGSDRDGTGSLEHVHNRFAALQKSGWRSLRQSARTWQRFYASAADIRYGDTTKEYLYAMALYSLRAGAHWHSGVTLGTNWTRKFGSMSFWDTFWACDGFLLAGRQPEVRAFTDWLNRTACRLGKRPHYWMTYYDGTPGSDIRTDRGYQTNLAFGQVAARLAAQTGRKDDKARAFEYLHKVAVYAFDELLAFDEAAGWRLKGKAAHDVGVEEFEASADKGITLWLVSGLAKCAEYGEACGRAGDPVVKRCRDVSDWFRDTQRVDITQGVWSGWILHLAAAQPFADYAAAGEALMPKEDWSAYSPTPWGNVTSACCFTLAGKPDLALAHLDMAEAHAEGLGYLGEFLYEYKLGGHSPYVPSEGGFLSAMLMPVANSRMWDDEVRVCVDLAERQKYTHIEWRGIHTLNGTVTSGVYAPYRVEVTVARDRPMRLRLRVPARMAGEPVRCTVNGQLRDAPAGADECVVCELPAGEYRVVIERDLEAPADVWLLEPFELGARLRDVLAQPGCRVRWHRDFRDVARVLGTCPVGVFDQFYGMLPQDVFLALQDFVRKGGRLVLLGHAACRRIDERMADWLGLNADHEGNYKYPCLARTFLLTEAGQAACPGVPGRFGTWMCHDITPHPAPDVEVWARFAETGAPAMTRRRYGAGTLTWIAMGDKLMGYDDPERRKRVHRGRNVMDGVSYFLLGRYRDEAADLRWLDENFGALLRSAVKNPS